MCPRNFERTNICYPSADLSYLIRHRPQGAGSTSFSVRLLPGPLQPHRVSKSEAGAFAVIATPGLALWESDCWGPVRGDPLRWKHDRGQGSGGKSVGERGGRVPAARLRVHPRPRPPWILQLHEWGDQDDPGQSEMSHPAEPCPANPRTAAKPHGYSTDWRWAGVWSRRGCLCRWDGSRATAQGAWLEWVQQEEST